MLQSGALGNILFNAKWVTSYSENVLLLHIKSIHQPPAKIGGLFSATFAAWNTRSKNH
jgi:hypothetical protein